MGRFLHIYMEKGFSEAYLAFAALTNFQNPFTLQKSGIAIGRVFDYSYLITKSNGEVFSIMLFCFITK